MISRQAAPVMGMAAAVLNRVEIIGRGAISNIAAYSIFSKSGSSSITPILPALKMTRFMFLYFSI
jgi:hypothetical protein